MEDFFVQECCVHGTDLENHGPTSILCDDPLPIESNADSILLLAASRESFVLISERKTRNVKRILS